MSIDSCPEKSSVSISLYINQCTINYVPSDLSKAGFVLYQYL